MKHINSTRLGVTLHKTCSIYDYFHAKMSMGDMSACDSGRPSHNENNNEIRLEAEFNKY